MHLAQTNDFNDGSMARADVNEVQEMTTDYIVEMVSEYHGSIWLYEWRHVRYEMASCIGDEFGDVQKQSRDLILVRITCESCENDF